MPAVIEAMFRSFERGFWAGAGCFVLGHTGMTVAYTGAMAGLDVAFAVAGATAFGAGLVTQALAEDRVGR